MNHAASQERQRMCAQATVLWLHRTRPTPLNRTLFPPLD
jgi:hypothetical protein